MQPSVLLSVCIHNLESGHNWAKHSGSTVLLSRRTTYALTSAGISLMFAGCVCSKRAKVMASVVKQDLGQLKSVASAFAFPGALQAAC